MLPVGSSVPDAHSQSIIVAPFVEWPCRGHPSHCWECAAHFSILLCTLFRCHIHSSLDSKCSVHAFCESSTEYVSYGHLPSVGLPSLTVSVFCLYVGSHSRQSRQRYWLLSCLLPFIIFLLPLSFLHVRQGGGLCPFHAPLTQPPVIFSHRVLLHLEQVHH